MYISVEKNICHSKGSPFTYSLILILILLLLLVFLLLLILCSLLWRVMVFYIDVIVPFLLLFTSFFHNVLLFCLKYMFLKKYKLRSYCWIKRWVIITISKFYRTQVYETSSILLILFLRIRLPIFELDTIISKLDCNRNDFWEVKRQFLKSFNIFWYGKEIFSNSNASFVENIKT